MNSWSDATNKNGATPDDSKFCGCKNLLMGGHGVIMGTSWWICASRKVLNGPNPALVSRHVCYSGSRHFEQVERLSCADAPEVFAISSISQQLLLQGIGPALFDLCECFAGDRHRGHLARVGLPTTNGHIDIQRVEFDGPRPATGLVRRHDRRARARKRVQHNVAAA